MSANDILSQLDEWKDKPIQLVMISENGRTGIVNCKILKIEGGAMLIEYSPYMQRNYNMKQSWVNLTSIIIDHADLMTDGWLSWEKGSDFQWSWIKSRVYNFLNALTGISEQRFLSFFRGNI